MRPTPLVQRLRRRISKLLATRERLVRRGAPAKALIPIDVALVRLRLLLRRAERALGSAGCF